MSVRAFVLNPTGQSGPIAIEPTLAGMSAIIGGPIEAVWLPQVGYLPRLVRKNPGLFLYVNELGVHNRLPGNHGASRIAHRQVVGTALIVRVDEEGNEVDLTDEDLGSLVMEAGQ